MFAYVCIYVYIYIHKRGMVHMNAEPASEASESHSMQHEVGPGPPPLAGKRGPRCFGNDTRICVRAMP